METEEQQNITPKEAYDARKLEKNEEKSKNHGNGNRVRSFPVGWVVTILVLIGVGALLFVVIRNVIPESEDFSREVTIHSRDHIAVGSVHDPYTTNPPASGPHYDTPALTGFYDVGEALPDERVVHNLEHGDVWIAYHPSIDSSVKELLSENFGDERELVITPREANETDIVLVAWGRIDEFDVDGTLDLERVNDFFVRYRNRGPETVNQDHREHGGGDHVDQTI
jgi:hypothetical protein